MAAHQTLPSLGFSRPRTLEWVVISFSNAWKWKVKVKLFSCVRLFTAPWTAAYQALPSVGFSRQEYWSDIPLQILPIFLIIYLFYFILFSSIWFYSSLFVIYNNADVWGIILSKWWFFCATTRNKMYKIDICVNHIPCKYMYLQLIYIINPCLCDEFCHKFL